MDMRKKLYGLDFQALIHEKCTVAADRLYSP